MQRILHVLIKTFIGILFVFYSVVVFYIDSSTNCLHKCTPVCLSDITFICILRKHIWKVQRVLDLRRLLIQFEELINIKFFFSKYVFTYVLNKRTERVQIV